MHTVQIYKWYSIPEIFQTAVIPQNNKTYERIPHITKMHKENNVYRYSILLSTPESSTVKDHTEGNRYHDPGNNLLVIICDIKVSRHEQSIMFAYMALGTHTDGSNLEMSGVMLSSWTFLW